MNKAGETGCPNFSNLKTSHGICLLSTVINISFCLIFLILGSWGYFHIQTVRTSMQEQYDVQAANTKAIQQLTGQLQILIDVQITHFQNLNDMDRRLREAEEIKTNRINPTVSYDAK